MLLSVGTVFLPLLKDPLLSRRRSQRYWHSMGEVISDRVFQLLAFPLQRIAAMRTNPGVKPRRSDACKVYQVPLYHKLVKV